MLSSVGLLALILPAHGAERDDLGPLQGLRPRTVLQVEIVDPATERISWFGETLDPSTGIAQPNVVEISDPDDNFVTLLASGQEFTPTRAGAWFLRAQGLDLAGPPAQTGPPDGEEDPMTDWRIEVVGAPPGLGRVWSRSWSLLSNTFSEAGATDGSFYAVVSGGSASVEGVVELKAAGLAGNSYTLQANEGGVVRGNGRSTESDGFALSPQYQIYLRPPDPAVVNYGSLVPHVSPPVLTGDGVCDGLAPGLSTASVSFDSDVEGTYHVVCDLSGDGQYDLTSDDDLHVLGEAEVGTNVVILDGTDNVGQPLVPDTYSCIVRLTVGEFHFVASDIETSYEGLRLFEVDRFGNRSGLVMFWNDAAVAYKDFFDPDPLDGIDELVRRTMPGGEESLDSSGPAGVHSGDYLLDPTIPNVNARSWGHFALTSKGNDSYLDTYTYIAADDSPEFDLVVFDSVSDADSDNLSDGEESCVVGTDPDLPDTDADGLTDFEEARLGASDPLVADTDGDGFTDGEETPVGPSPPDTDGDGLQDAVDPDDDGDGLSTLLELRADSDGDTVPDHLDDDDDGDGVPTAQEDTDGDGVFDDDADGDDVVDYLDDDDDGDGIPGGLEDVDLDGVFDDDSDEDGLPDRVDPDDDGDGVPSLVEGVVDSDGDGLPDYLDDDDDDDGVPTLSEAPGDTDGDGLDDRVDPDDDGDGLLTRLEDPDGDGDILEEDSDVDGIPDYLDDDDDGDLVPTRLEDVDGDGVYDDDTDGDDVPNYLDPDDDGDTIPTSDEVDLDEDGVLDDPLEDTDDDGIPNYLDDDDDGDGIPTELERDLDSDQDGIPDYLDTDADNDSLPDADEGLIDSDDDFVPDFQDADDDGDGVRTLDELQGGAPGPDTDDDGVPDYLDPDDDGDGIITFREGGFGDDADGDGIPNHHDLDSDADGLPDADEGEEDPDVDGLGNFIDTDSDDDGFDDAEEGLTDSDADGLPDFVDEDDDADGVPSVREFDGDTDGDGVDDRLDEDDDGDGIPTSVESQDALIHGDDVDGDGAFNWVDLDSDGDEIPDAEEGVVDVDGDNVPDYLDPDGAYLAYYRGSGLLSCSSVNGGSMATWLMMMAAAGLSRRRKS